MKKKINIDGIEYELLTAGGKFYTSNDFGKEEVFYNGEWYKKKEKEYEILEFKNTVGNTFYIDEGLYNCDRIRDGHYLNRTADDILTNATACYIFKVKRLLDSEIFTIGDIVYHSNSRPEEAIVTGFHIENEKLIVETKDHGHIHLHYAKKFPKFEFKCEDGIVTDKWKEIYILGSNWGKKEDKPINAIHFQKEWKFFTTKEARDEYILKNKPLLSFQDVEDLDHARNGKVYIITNERLQERLKSKL